MSKHAFLTYASSEPIGGVPQIFPQKLILEKKVKANRIE